MRANRASTAPGLRGTREVSGNTLMQGGHLIAGNANAETQREMRCQIHRGRRD